MARSPGGQVLKRKWKSGYGYALRFPAYGERHYLTLGTEADGWTHERAAEELQNVLADVRRGIWIPPDRNRPTGDPSPEAAREQVRFHRFASHWLGSRRGELRPRSIEHLEWALTYHLLPYFANWRLSEIDIEAVDSYRRHKIHQADERRRAIERGRPLTDADGRTLRPLAPATINKTIDVMQAVLAVAVEYGQIPTNPAAGRRRRLRPCARRPVHLDTAHQIEALLHAARQLDRDPYWRTNDRTVVVATLVLAGLRAHELCDLVWRDVDLANGRIQIRSSKTQAGLREIPLLPLLRDELAAHKARAGSTVADDPVFPTGSGGSRDKDNLRNRLLAPTLRRADELLAERREPPLPAGVTPHKLRHTFASILVACGEDPASVMAQLGHTDPKFTLRTYTHLMRRDPRERRRLKQLVQGGYLPALQVTIASRWRSPDGPLSPSSVRSRGGRRARSARRR